MPPKAKKEQLNKEPVSFELDPRRPEVNPGTWRTQPWYKLANKLSVSGLVEQGLTNPETARKDGLIMFHMQDVRKEILERVVLTKEGSGLISGASSEPGLSEIPEGFDLAIAIHDLVSGKRGKEKDPLPAVHAGVRLGRDAYDSDFAFVQANVDSLDFVIGSGMTYDQINGILNEISEADPEAKLTNRENFTVNQDFVDDYLNGLARAAANGVSNEDVNKGLYALGIAVSAARAEQLVAEDWRQKTLRSLVFDGNKEIPPVDRQRWEYTQNQVNKIVEKYYESEKKHNPHLTKSSFKEKIKFELYAALKHGSAAVPNYLHDFVPPRVEEDALVKAANLDLEAVILKSVETAVNIKIEEREYFDQYGRKQKVMIDHRPPGQAARWRDDQEMLSCYAPYLESLGFDSLASWISSEATLDLLGDQVAPEVVRKAKERAASAHTYLARNQEAFLHVFEKMRQGKSPLVTNMNRKFSFLHDAHLHKVARIGGIAATLLASRDKTPGSALRKAIDRYDGSLDLIPDYVGHQVVIPDFPPGSETIDEFTDRAMEIVDVLLASFPRYRIITPRMKAGIKNDTPVELRIDRDIPENAEGKRVIEKPVTRILKFKDGTERQVDFVMRILPPSPTNYRALHVVLMDGTQSIELQIFTEGWFREKTPHYMYSYQDLMMEPIEDAYKTATSRLQEARIFYNNAFSRFQTEEAAKGKGQATRKADQGMLTAQHALAEAIDYFNNAQSYLFEMRSLLNAEHEKILQPVRQRRKDLDKFLSGGIPGQLSVECMEYLIENVGPLWQGMFSGLGDRNALCPGYSAYSAQKQREGWLTGPTPDWKSLQRVTEGTIADGGKSKKRKK